MILSGTMVWFLVALGLVAVRAFPVLVAQNSGLKQALKQSALLTVDNIAVSFVWLLVSLATLGVGAATGIGLFCGLLGALGLWLSIVHHRLIAKYTGEKVAEEPPRRLRDLLRPWEE